MGRAGKALKQVLANYDITQNRLAVVMGITRSSVHRWVYEIGDPVADAVIELEMRFSKSIQRRLRSLLGFTLGRQPRMRSNHSGRSAIALLQSLFVAIFNRRGSDRSHPIEYRNRRYVGAG
jgi:transcriptional regulator with XRE-family HTH domain